jgi:hypothetical protein
MATYCGQFQFIGTFTNYYALHASRRDMKSGVCRTHPFNTTVPDYSPGAISHLDGFGSFVVFVFKHYFFKLIIPSFEKGKLRLPNTELTLAFPSIL